jgi:hypothetical protein
MKGRFCQIVPQVGLPMLFLVMGTGLLAHIPASAQGDQTYAGKWVGTYASDGGGSGNVTYVLSKDEKGQWQGTIKYTNQDGEKTANLRGLEIAGGKFRAKLDGPDNEVEVALEGEFKGNGLSGTYTVLQKSSKEVAEKGTWKTAKS